MFIRTEDHLVYVSWCYCPVVLPLRLISLGGAIRGSSPALAPAPASQNPPDMAFGFVAEEFLGFISRLFKAFSLGRG